MPIKKQNQAANVALTPEAVKAIQAVHNTTVGHLGIHQMMQQLQVTGAKGHQCPLKPQCRNSTSSVPIVRSLPLKKLALLAPQGSL